MVAFPRFGHYLRKALSIRKINEIGGLAFLSSLIFVFLPGLPVCASRQYVTGIDPQDKVIFLPTGKTSSPVSELTPFPIMVKHRLATWRIPIKEITYRQMFPLTAGLELVKDSTDD